MTEARKRPTTREGRLAYKLLRDGMYCLAGTTAIRLEAGGELTIHALARNCNLASLVLGLEEKHMPALLGPYGLGSTETAEYTVYKSTARFIRVGLWTPADPDDFRRQYPDNLAYTLPAGVVALDSTTLPGIRTGTLPPIQLIAQKPVLEAGSRPQSTMYDPL